MARYTSPDATSNGLTNVPVHALRYDSNEPVDPVEVTGLFRELMPSKVRVLDVGCGTGSLAMIANRDKDNEVYGIEPDPDRAALAAQRGLKMRVGFLDQAYIDEHGTFDVIMASDVLEHVSEPAALLDLFKAALSPGGRILVSVPNVAHWSVRLNIALGRFDYEPTGIMDATHLRWFTTKTLRELFERSGLEVGYVGHSAGQFLEVYRRRPFRRIPKSSRFALVRRGLKLIPQLIGCQIVLEARLK